MSDTAIRAESLGKHYRSGPRERYRTLRDTLVAAGRRANTPPISAEVWALRGASFSVRRGERVGIIGRNGAGKSTLLKLLARIMRPTEGRAELRGRVGSLLELGTGFHQELTARENIFLSGAILGMPRAEIAARQDEIVAFAGVEKFLEMPLKHLSDGMQARLGFAVAAHLDTEILLVDEVLAVGDLEFQRKCLGKMDDVTRAGRTVVFVSHQFGQIRRLCRRALWLDRGHIRMDGTAGEVIAAYELDALAGGSRKSMDDDPGAATRFVCWELTGGHAEMENRHLLASTGPVRLLVLLDVASPPEGAYLEAALHTPDGLRLWGWAMHDVRLRTGRNALSFAFPSLPLRPGTYEWSFGLWDGTACLDRWTAVPHLRVETENYQHPFDAWGGVLNLPCVFDVEQAHSPVADAPETHIVR